MNRQNVDTNQHGSVRKKGNTWYIRYRTIRDDGSWEEHEKKGGKTRSEALAKLRDVVEEYKEVGDICDPGNITLEDLANLWFEKEIKNDPTLSSNTVYDYGNTMRHLLEHDISKIKLKKLTISHLQTYVDEQTYGVYKDGVEIQKGYSKSMVHKQHVFLRSLFKFACDPKNHFLRTNLYDSIEKRKPIDEYDLFGAVEFTENKIITKEDFNRIMEFITTHPVYHFYALPLYICYYTGLRVGEVCGLIWADINIDERYLLVRRSMYKDKYTGCWELKVTKSKKPRRVEFNDVLANILREAKQNHLEKQRRCGSYLHRHYYQTVDISGKRHTQILTDMDPSVRYMGSRVGVGKPLEEAKPNLPVHSLEFLCSKEDGELLTPQSMKYLNKLIQRNVLGMEFFHMHLLRHSYASTLITSGVDPKTVQELMGHSSCVITTDVYGHSDFSNKKAAARLIE